MLRSEDVGSAWFYKSLGRREAVILSHAFSKWPDLCLTPNATGTGHSSFALSILTSLLGVQGGSPEFSLAIAGTFNASANCGNQPDGA